MRRLLKYKRTRRLFLARTFVGILSLVLMFLLFVSVNAVVTERGAKERRDTRASVLSQLETRKEGLSAELSKLSSDEGVEREIRSKYDLGKEGEGVIIVLDSKGDETASSTEVRETLFSRFIEFIF